MESILALAMNSDNNVDVYDNVDIDLSDHDVSDTSGLDLESHLESNKENDERINNFIRNMDEIIKSNNEKMDEIRKSHKSWMRRFWILFFGSIGITLAIDYKFNLS